MAEGSICTVEEENEIVMNQISREQLAELSSLTIENPQKALALLRDYDKEYKGDPNFQRNSGGFLIDIGDSLGKSDIVQEGIERIEAVLDKGEYGHPGVLYNVANGYSNLCNIMRRSKGKVYRLDPDDTPLLQAKHYYRKAIKTIDQANRGLRAQLWVNYGNCLSGLGRTVDAISAYDRALQAVPDHCMAKGNLAIELYHFARIAQYPVFLLDALEMLERVLATDGLEKRASIGARQVFERVRDRIAADISDLGVERTVQERQEPTVPSGYVREYIDFCAKHQLFMNFCLGCRRCDRYFKDSLTFSLITDIDDTTSFKRLTRVVNEIKESYALARLLLFQALHPSLDTVTIDDLTAYVDNLDYAVYGIRTASLKLAFESAYNILDKIAHFLNDYLNLGIKYDPNVKFTMNGRIWRKNKHRLRSELLELDNQHLFGLYDLARDLAIDYKQPEKNGYWGHLRRTRNSLTHEYLIPHIEATGWAVEADDESLHLYYADLVDQTIDLLQFVRAAVIHLIAFIDLEERKKREVSEGLIAPMYITWYEPTLFTPALDLGHWDS